MLNVGDEVQVYVLSIDPQTKKIALSLKKAQPDPWSLVEDRYKVGDVVEGTITKLAKFGAFARIDDGIEGLIHLSELSEAPVEKPQDAVSEGQEVKLRVIAINSQRRRLGLSLRQAQGDTLRPVEVPENIEDFVDGGDEPSFSARAQRSVTPTAAPEPPQAAPEERAETTTPEATAAPVDAPAATPEGAEEIVENVADVEAPGEPHAEAGAGPAEPEAGVAETSPDEPESGVPEAGPDGTQGVHE